MIAPIRAGETSRTPFDEAEPGHPNRHAIEVTPPKRPQIQVPAVKIRGDCRELLLDFRLAQGQRAAEDMDELGGVGRNEWADEHPRAVRPKRDAGGPKAQAAHVCRIATCAPSARLSSASER